MNTTTFESIDVRQIPPAQRHPLIFGCFDALPPGAAFEIVNDHDPAPLRLQFEKTRLGQFAWQYIASGPLLWQVRISRVKGGAAGGQTGGCGGTCGCGGA